MTISVLKPKETAIFENEQKSRFSPNDVVSGLTGAPVGKAGIITFSADGNGALGTVTRHNNMGGALMALRLLDDVAILDNDTYTLENDGVVNPPSQLAVVLIDVNDSITNIVITINGTDAADGAISDVLTFTSGGEVQFTANGPYKTVTNISNGVITGTFSGDQLRVLARIEDTEYALVTRAHDVLLEANAVENDPNTGADDDKGAYIQSVEITDQEAFVSYPAMPADVDTIQSVVVKWDTKNLTASAAGGIDLLLRHTGTTFIIANNNLVRADNVTSSPSAQITIQLAPGTGSAWTIAQFDSLELGVRFRGDNPAVTKQWMRVRLEVNVRTLPTNVSAIDVEEQFIEAVSGDPFDEGATDDGKYFHSWGGQGAAIAFGYESLPAEAVDVLNVKAFWRAAQINEGHPNGAQDNTYHCAIGGANSAGTPSVQPRGGTGRHYGDGPQAQNNLGGWRPQASSPSGGSEQSFGDEDRGRIHNGPGAPTGGCVSGGPTFEMAGRNLAWGTFVNHSELMPLQPKTVPPQTTAWSVVSFNGMTTLFEDGGRDDLYRYSKAYVEPEWTRNPTGDLYLHLVLRDDFDTPNDATFMSSQHPSNKQFGCNFAGIDEATQINSITGTVRGWTTLGASKGWKIKLQVLGTQYDDPALTEHMNTTPAYKTAVWSQHPTELREWTRDEVNSAVLIFEAQGENAYFPKFLSNMGLTVDFLGIPAKIDTARRLGSEVLLFQGQPVPILEMRTPFIMGDVKLITDVSVTADLVPSVIKTLGIEKWERALFRSVEKELDPNTDTWVHRLYDLRDFLLTFLASFQVVTKGRGFDGMSLITPGANLQFVRGTNDYQPDPFADLVQELQGNEPAIDETGILITNQGINRVVNSAFAEGAVDVFDGWTKVGLPAAGAQIVESNRNDLLPITVSAIDYEGKSIYDAETGIDRSVFMVGADTPADIYIERDVSLPTGESLSPEGGRHVLTVTHEDPTGHPLSVWLRGKPVGFAEENLDPRDDTWIASNPTWFTLPVRSTPTRDRIISPFATLHDQNQTAGFRDFYNFALRIGVRTSANQVNRIFDAGTEGGTILSGDELMFPRTRILSRTGPVVRDGAELFVANISDTPVYYLQRGTGFCVMESLWDTAELPNATGVRRYIFGMTITGTTFEELYYDVDNEEFVYKRTIASVAFTATKKFRGIAKGVPIRIAWRWISFEGDLGENPFSTQIFINDVRGTDGAATSSPPQPSSVPFYIGSFNGTNGQMLDGRIRRMRITQQALPLDRIKKLR